MPKTPAKAVLFRCCGCLGLLGLAASNWLLPVRICHFQSTEYSILVIGVPNVGKSSLINSLRRLHLKKGISLSLVPGLGEEPLAQLWTVW